MRRPNNVFLSLHDVSLDDVADSLDCDGRSSSSCRHDESALCCPDDSLDTVLGCIPPLEDELLEALGIDCSSSLLTLDGNPNGAEEDDMDVEARTADAPPKFNTTSTASFSRCSLSSASCDDDPEYSLPVQEQQLVSPFHHWTIPKKPRGRAGTVRKRPWGPHPVIVAATGNQFSHGINGGRRQPTEAHPFIVAAAGNQFGQGSNVGRRHATEAHPVIVAATGNQFAQGSNGGGSGGRRQPVNPRRRRRRPENEDETRACSHCHTTDTPQWREGPLGRRTLCNACGLRYKMGREKLVPEYCPSTSPFFRDGKHSNRHSKVEKLRKRKEEKASMESS